MKRFVCAVLVASAAAGAFAADIGVSVNVGQPGFYGQLNIGDFPRPVFINSQPIIVDRGAHFGGAPIYLRVPPGHQKHWSKHCGEYNACGRPVQFVDDRWYNDVYAPKYRERHGGSEGRDGRDGRQDDERGNGRGNHGKGHGRG